MDTGMLFWSVLLFLLVSVHSANILVIVPFPSWSHQQPFIAISKELITRGHHITIITSDPPKENIENLTSIDISSSYRRFGEFHKEFGFTMQKDWTAFIFVTKLAPLFAHLSDYALSEPNVQEFLRNINNTKFDLVILEHLMFSSFSGLVHKIGSPPVVGVSTLPNNSPTDWGMGVPINPSYMPDMFVGYTDKMDFFQRVYNTIFYWWMKYQAEMRMIPMQEKVMRKHFGYDAPSAREFEHNKSLVLMSADLTLTYPMPLPPNLVQIGPLHIKPANPLPKDLEEWCVGAEDGIVYFSLGSNMKGTSLKEEKREAFVKAFAKFPKIRFLWKWESDVKIPGLSSNVLTRKWFPQQDIFGHKKLRLFIMQGGLQSLQEAINYGIPILGIPLFADQRHNTWKMAKEGAGISLEMRDVTPETVYNILKTILYDEKIAFKKNASRLSEIAKDKLTPALDTAAWWIEYVLRHNGARHLRMASFDLSWYQISLIDVYGFLLIVLLSVTAVLYYVIRTFAHKISLSVSKGKIRNKDDVVCCNRTADCKREILKNNLEGKKTK